MDMEGEDDDSNLPLTVEEGDDTLEEEIAGLSVAGVTLEELEAATALLRRLHPHAQLIADGRSQPIKAFRTALRSVTPGSVFDDVREYKSRHRRKKEAHRRQQQQRALDRKRMEVTQIRSARLEALTKLLEPTLQPELQQKLLTSEEEQQQQQQQQQQPAFGEVAIEAESESDTTTATASSSVSGTSVDIEGEIDPVVEEARVLIDGEYYFPKSCYTCKMRFYKPHFFYDRLCPSCAELNYEKRNQMADLNGKVAILTGGRVKIGYQCGLKMLRCGATVIVTTRFPRDSCARYAKEPDFAEWQSRLHCYGLDLRNLVEVHRFVDWVIETFDRLDIIVNNAAQTVRRPPSFYSHLIPSEMTALPHALEGLLAHNTNLAQTDTAVPRLLAAEASSLQQQATPPLGELTPASSSALMSQVPLTDEDRCVDASLFPKGFYDEHQQQVDMRTRNSWTMRMDEVSTIELIEVHAINALAPFIINSKLKPLMARTPGSKYIVNVSAMEGKFYRHKTPFHPHTNMAKASLNMMTRTAAADYAEVMIYMNCVDTGWITDENPLHTAVKIAESGFVTPIDEADAAARILDPILSGLNTGINKFGQFFKDFTLSEW